MARQRPRPGEASRLRWAPWVDATAVHDPESHVRSVRRGEPLKLDSKPVYLSR